MRVRSLVTHSNETVHVAPVFLLQSLYIVFLMLLVLRLVWFSSRVLLAVVGARLSLAHKLTAVSGSPIQVDGDAKLEFLRGGRKCSVKFLNADVKRSLASVRVIVMKETEWIDGTVL